MRMALTAAAVLLPGVPAAPAQEAFRIGLVALPGEDAGVEGLAGIKAAYSAALGMPVEVMVARDYAALAEAQIAGRIDYAAYSAPAFAAAALRCGCVVPVAAPVDADGSVGLRSVLIVRGVSSRGEARLAVGPADSLATRLVPLAASAEAREAATSGRLVETASALEAESLFVAGEVDGFFGWVPAGPDDGTEPPGGSPARLAAAGLEPPAWRIAWRSTTLRYGPHAVRADTAPARVEKLVGLLQGIAPGEAGPGRQIMRGHDRFAAVSPADYRAVIDALAALDAR